MQERRTINSLNIFSLSLLIALQSLRNTEEKNPALQFGDPLWRLIIEIISGETAHFAVTMATLDRVKTSESDFLSFLLLFNDNDSVVNERARTLTQGCQWRSAHFRRLFLFYPY